MPNNSSEFNEASFREAYAQYLDECRRNEEARAMQRAREIERERMYAMPIETAPSVRLTVSTGPLSESHWGPYTYVSVPSSPSEYEECTVSAPPPQISRSSAQQPVSNGPRPQPSENMRWRLYPDEPIKRVTALGNEF